MLIRREIESDGEAIRHVHDAAFADDGATASEVVGHVVGNRARIDEHPSLGLGPLGVLPAYQRHGLGDPGYYGRFGFQLAQQVGVLPPDPEWAPRFQIRTLTTWNDGRHGVFRYAEAFDL